MSMDVSKMPKLGFGLMRLPEKDGEIDMARYFIPKVLLPLPCRDILCPVASRRILLFPSVYLPFPHNYSTGFTF